MSDSFVREAFKSDNRFLLRIAIVAAMGGFLFGYDTGIISGAQLYIKKDFSTSTLQQQWIVGSLLIGAIVGAMISAYLADRIGRRWTKVAAGTVYVIGGLASGFAPNIYFLFGARFVLGVAVGTASFVSVEYISEQAPPRLRGGVTTFNQLMVTTGILIAYLVSAGFQNVTGTWRWMLGLSIVPGLALAIGMLFVPYSPRWLVSKERYDEAREVLEHTRTEQEASDEVDGIRDTVQAAGSIELKSLFVRPLRPLMIVGLALAIGQQLIGVNTVIYYSATILKSTGLSANSSILQAISVGLTNVVFTIVAILLIDKVGRRPLLLIGTAGSVLALIGLGAWFRFEAVHQYSVLALVCLLLFIAFYAIGLGPVFWLMISEIYPLGVRSKAMGVATVAKWAGNFVVSYFFLQLVGAVGQSGTFWIYAGFGVLAFVFFYAKLPETKDRSLEQIESDLGVDPEAVAQQSG